MWRARGAGPPSAKRDLRCWLPRSMPRCSRRASRLVTPYPGKQQAADGCRRRTPGPPHPNDSVDPTRCSGHMLELVSNRWRRCTSVPIPPAHRPFMTAAATSCKPGAGTQGSGRAHCNRRPSPAAPPCCAWCEPPCRRALPKDCCWRSTGCAAAPATDNGSSGCRLHGERLACTHQLGALHDRQRSPWVVGLHEFQGCLAGGANAGGHPKPLKIVDAADRDEEGKRPRERGGEGIARLGGQRHLPSTHLPGKVCSGTCGGRAMRHTSRHPSLQWSEERLCPEAHSPGDSHHRRVPPEEEDCQVGGCSHRRRGALRIWCL